MRRTDRLFEIIQLFRADRLLLAKDIAGKLEVSLRTIYRDINSLISSGVPIEGEREVGYILRAPIFLPPLALTNSELEALHLGVKMVQQSTDLELSNAAEKLLQKIEAGLSNEKRNIDHLQDLSIFPANEIEPLIHLATIRNAISIKQILKIEYVSLDGEKSIRQIRPLHVEYWGKVWTCPAWCELRNNFRVFRIDRIKNCQIVQENYFDEVGKTYKDYLSQLTY